MSFENVFFEGKKRLFPRDKLRLYRVWKKFFGGGANVSGYGGFLLVGGLQNSNNG